MRRSLTRSSTDMTEISTLYITIETLPFIYQVSLYLPFFLFGWENEFTHEIWTGVGPGAMWDSRL